MPLYSLGNSTPKLPSSGDFWIAPDAHVVGKIEIDDEVAVWFGAVLRGDNELIKIGKGSNIQENACLHTDLGAPLTVGENCTIGHNAILHGCTIGDNSLIGMGAIILNHVKIGNNCLVGAGSLVTEGKEFPDGSLIVGSPAKAIKILDDATREKLKLSALGYVKNYKRFKSYLKRID